MEDNMDYGLQQGQAAANYCQPQQQVVQGMMRPANCDVPMQVTNIIDLQNYSQGTLVRLPDFAEGQPLVVRLRRPSLLILAKQGKIPNELMSVANDLFDTGGKNLDLEDTSLLSKMYGVMEAVCEASLVSPTMKDFRDANIDITDEQILAVFNYSQGGVESLKSFRKVEEDSNSDFNEPNLQGQTE